MNLTDIAFRLDELAEELGIPELVHLSEELADHIENPNEYSSNVGLFTLNSTSSTGTFARGGIV